MIGFATDCGATLPAQDLITTGDCGAVVRLGPAAAAADR